MDAGFGREIEQNGLLTKSDLDESLAVILSKKRVRMPSSILSELYPSIPSPYYRQGGLAFGQMQSTKIYSSSSFQRVVARPREYRRRYRRV